MTLFAQHCHHRFCAIQMRDLIVTLMYHSEITSILDRMVPVRQRSSDPYFDEECRAAKRPVRQLEPASMRASLSLLCLPPPTSLLLQLSVPPGVPSGVSCVIGNVKHSGGRKLTLNDHHLSAVITYLSDRHFDDKVANIEAATAGAPLPTGGSLAPTGCSLFAFSTLSVTDVTAAIHQLLDKQCANDPLPTRLLKDNA